MVSLPVVAIVGVSNSGKTTVAAGLTRMLTARGLRVASIKHAPHGHDADRPSSDSACMRKAGAVSVTVASPNRVTTTRDVSRDYSLDELVAATEPVWDIVIAEGYKGSAVRKILVGQGEVPDPLPESIMAVVGDCPGAPDAPNFQHDDIEALSELLIERLLEPSSGATSAVLLADGVPVPLGPFPSRALAGVLSGFLESLNAVPESVSRVQATLRLGTSWRRRSGKS